MKRGTMILIVVIAALLIASGMCMMEARAEEQELRPLIVTASGLYGRQHPTKKSQKEALFDYGDRLTPTGRISQDCEWVEVYGGETGTVWVAARYVTERMDGFTVKNLNNGRIRIRAKLGGKGKLKGYVGHGKSIVIDRVVLGWGHCSRGWVDLEYFIEEVERF